MLEKTQTEADLEIKAKHPEGKKGQRSFERRKPFFVGAPRSQDKITCCCWLHVEIRMVFQFCREFRRSVIVKRMYAKAESNSYHCKECVKRECNQSKNVQL